MGKKCKLNVKSIEGEKVILDEEISNVPRLAPH